ncbi:hypothetical protein WJX74_001201 [Apatococcus lobatus]|uniref:MoaB/Mog domain-containing protein n=2 Tax=Apatococcus TaxID=904362 RepID=A0AAW1T331_9CHLO
MCHLLQAQQAAAFCRVVRAQSFECLRGYAAILGVVRYDLSAAGSVLRQASCKLHVRPRQNGPSAYATSSFATSCATASQTQPKLAAFLVIGNEILTGSVQDANTPWLAQLLYRQGVDLIRVEYIPDDKSDIASTLLRLKERVGHKGVIFTSGGIGPTHDDITYESVAHAFGVELEVHKPTVEAMKAHYEPQGKEVNESRLRMATIPIGSEVLTTPDLWVPMACIHDVFILPGIPRLFKAMITANKDRFTGAAYLSATLYTDTGEGDVAQALRKIAAEHPDVRIGSYPNTSYDKTYQVKLQLECRQQDLLDQAKVAVSEALTVRE